MANIFSFGDLSDTYKITHDNRKDDAFYLKDGKMTRRFERGKEGLYYLKFDIKYIKSC